MIPSPTVDVLAVLRTEVENDPLGRGYAGMGIQQIASSLNEVNIESTRLPMLSLESLGGHVNDGEYNAVFDHPTFAAFLTHVVTQNRPFVLAWLRAYRRRGLVSQQSFDACAAHVTATVPTTISRASQLGITSPVTPSILASAGIMGVQ